jgi:transcription initiation factor TFIIIB Brf1 subunit/transcription initiation factor TFIIB
MKIKIELIGMKCDECNSVDNYFDERLGERVCSECGLVLITHMFEETTHILDSVGDVVHTADNDKLGSVITGQGSFKYNRFQNPVVPKHITNGIMYCNMVLSNVTHSQESKDRVEKVYTELCSSVEGFTRYTYENRATAVVFYVLREAGTPSTMKEVCAEFEVEVKLVKRILRKINAYYKNASNRNTVSPIYYLDKTVKSITNDLSFLNQCRTVLEKFETVIANSSFNKSKSYYASICWITSNIYVREYTRTVIAEKSGYNEKCVYLQTRALLNLFGFTDVNDVKGIDINKLGV